MEKQAILQFWRDVEIFDLPNFNDEAKPLNNDEVLPWLQKQRTAKDHYKWRYTIIFGKIEKKLILDHLKTLLKVHEDNDWEEPVRGFSCFSALILDEKGSPQEDSYITACYPFGINALENNEKLSVVSKDLEKAKEDFLERYNIPPQLSEKNELTKGDVVTWEHLNREINYVKKLNNWFKEDIKVFVLIEEVPKDSEPNSGFLNSFYLDDLNLLSETAEKNLGIALQQYLKIQPFEEERRDLIKHKELLFESFNPNQMTAGRWPSKIEYGLYSAQAGAVNTIFSTLRNHEGLLGVNGPPGTGKTTLLLDVISEIIVERARVISNLGCDALFQGEYKKIEKESGFALHTYGLTKTLQKNFGIVVASNNNAAVENISKELPLKSKIDQTVFPDADYFSDCSKTIIDDESWGVLAAALGSAKNRSIFKKAFWLTDSDKDIIGFNALLHQVYKDPENDTIHLHRESFENQNKHFQSLLKEFEEFKKLAGSFHLQLPEFIQNKKDKSRIGALLKQLTKNLTQLADQKQVALDKEDNRKKDVEHVQATLHLHKERKPSFFFFHKLFKTNSFRIWNTEAEIILTNLKSINSDLEELKRELDNNDRDTQSLLSQKKEYNNTLSRISVFFAAYKELEDMLSQKYDIETKNLLNVEFFEKDLSSIHLLLPYHSSKIEKLRSEIFLTALHLHHDAILVNAKKIRNNLSAYFEMTAGWVKVDNDIAQNLWDTFFFTVPVVSTTLASASRLFPNSNKRQIGWLLIDEAGQATPQSAAGLIHRAKRCVIVGDPLQVEPVVTMPEKLVTKLRKEHAVDLQWSPYKVSVQQLADRVSTAGTYMNVGNSDEKIWTGFPLRTHRRCDDPMFSIANDIAYSNQMVKAINTNSAEVYIGPSQWFDVSTAATILNKHVVKEEITLLVEKVSELRSIGYEDNIYIISPFKSIASYCTQQFKNQKKVLCGTIHTFQGKEADIVFLVLGSDPKSSGARNWASQKPNMLNVALTRAKKRFYVIGNKKLWASCNYFNTMVRMLQ